jgi:hypothetical protein
MGERMRLECSLRARRVCTLYYLEPRLACSRCNGLWYAAQRTSSYGRRVLAKLQIRRNLGDYGQLWATECPPRRRVCDEGPMSVIARRRPGSSANSVIDLTSLFERVFDGVHASLATGLVLSAVRPLPPIWILSSVMTGEPSPRR